MVITAICACCGCKETYKLLPKEAATLAKYRLYGRQLGMLQNLFPNIPAWIRSGAIDQTSGGFCICPKCKEV